MAVSRNFVIKKGLEVNQSLLFTDTDNQRICIGSTQHTTSLDVALCGIAATDLRISGLSTFVGLSEFGSGADVTGIVTVTLGFEGSSGVTTLAPSGGITTTKSDLYVGGDLYVKDDIVYDEVTGRNLNITGIGTIANAYSTNFLVSGIATAQAGFEGAGGITTVGGSGGITTTSGDLYVGGDLYVKDDISYDEVTGRNINITGVGTIAYLNATNANVTGYSTVAISSATQLYVSGVGTFGTLAAESYSGTATFENLQVGSGGTVFSASESGTVTVNESSVPTLGLVIALGS